MLSRCLGVRKSSQPGSCCSAVVQLLSRSCLSPGLLGPSTAQSGSIHFSTHNDQSAVVAHSLGFSQQAALQQNYYNVAAAAVPSLAARSYATRLGFGNKVALPAHDVLRQEVVSGADGPVEVILRAYHVGSRIHIGRMLQQLKTLYPECNLRLNTTAGKDYAIVWLEAILQHGPPAGSIFPNEHSFQSVIAKLTRVVGGHVPSKQVLAKVLWNLAQHGSSSGGDGSSIGSGGSDSSRSGGGAGGFHSSDNSSSSSTNSGGGSSSSKQDPDMQRQLRRLRPVRYRDRSQEVVTLPYYPGYKPQLQPLPPEFPKLTKQDGTPQPPFMAVYRSGSVVFGGLGEKEELWWLSQLVPPSVRYTGEDGSPWTKGRRVPSVSSKESHVVVVDAGCPADAQQGNDEVRLRVLDVGAVRVLTSVLAQSAALRFYEESVQKALVLFADWRAAHQTSHFDRSSRAFRFLVTHKQEKVLFKVIAASALIITEARQLLEMAEPAWQYDTYNKIWEVMAQDYQLEARIRSLEVKLEQVEREAKFDVQARAGRRAGMLNNSIVWLLVVSCMLAVLNVVVNESKVQTAAADEAAGDDPGSSDLHVAAAAAAASFVSNGSEVVSV